MCVTRALFRTIVMLVLLVNSGGKRRCNYTEILGTYRGLIFVDLQNLNIPFHNSSIEKSLCHSDKAHRILGSIYIMTQRMRCQIGDKRYKMSHSLESMEHVINNNCRPDYRGEPFSCATDKKIKGKKKKRIHLNRKINALITCWEKLHSVFTMKRTVK